MSKFISRINLSSKIYGQSTCPVYQNEKMFSITIAKEMAKNDDCFYVSTDTKKKDVSAERLLCTKPTNNQNLMVSV